MFPFFGGPVTGVVIGVLIAVVRKPGPWLRRGIDTMNKPALQAGVASMSRLPGLVINVVFAGIVIGKALPPVKQIWNYAAPHVILGNMFSFGQFAGRFRNAVHLDRSSASSMSPDPAWVCRPRGPSGPVAADLNEATPRASRPGPPARPGARFGTPRGVSRRDGR
ncbi:hypothetical protein [Streptomyces yanii]|uniref:Uncharacterized protein n=1 Tax=Streptomyces yanii TaxID=78510 RepID=A0ABV5R7L3_9ACTN